MSERYLKQVIVMRKDLSMPHGKLAVMVAHASMKFLADAIQRAKAEEGSWTDALYRTEEKCTIDLSAEQIQWLTEPDPGLEKLGQPSFAKIVVFADSEEELLDVQRRALEAELTVGTVHDAGYSHNPPGTFVGLAIGPHWPEAFVGITDHLKTR